MSPSSNRCHPHQAARRRYRKIIRDLNPSISWSSVSYIQQARRHTGKSELKSMGKEQAAACYNVEKGLGKESKYSGQGLRRIWTRVLGGFQSSRKMHCANCKATHRPFLRNSWHLQQKEITVSTLGTLHTPINSTSVLRSSLSVLFLDNLGHKLIYLPKFNISVCLFCYFTSLHHLQIFELGNMVMVYSAPLALVRRQPCRRQNILKQIIPHLPGSEFREFAVGMWDFSTLTVRYSECPNSRQSQIKRSSPNIFVLLQKAVHFHLPPFNLVPTLSISLQLISSPCPEAEFRICLLPPILRSAFSTVFR